MTLQRSSISQRAIVIGGGVAGICMARVLSDRFSEVLLIERDDLSIDDSAKDDLAARPELRSGIPQGRHNHLLLARGQLELEQLFPGFKQRMQALGAVEVDPGMDIAVRASQGWVERVPTEIPMLCSNRARTDLVLRELLLKIPNIVLKDHTEVIGVVAEDRGYLQIKGVRTRRRHEGEEELDAILVVDASGRNSRLLDWLAAFGVRPPEETVVDSKLAYASRWYQSPPKESWPRGWWWKAAVVGPMTADRPMAAVIFPGGENEWVATLVVSGRSAPRDAESFLKVLGSLESPLLVKMLDLAKPLTPLFGFQGMPNRLRHFERWPFSVGGLLVTGDSVCTFNPVYGQGMTTAALMAPILAQCLWRFAPGDPRLAQRFFRAQAEALQDPWLMATLSDFRLPWTRGKPQPLIDFSLWYIDILIHAAMTDPELRVAVDRVYHMLAPAQELRAPRMMQRVLKQAVKDKLWKMNSLPPPALPPI